MKLNKHYTLEQDTVCVLLKYAEPKTKVNKEGATVDYISTDTWYYPTIKAGLRAYLNKVIFDKNIEGVLKRITEVETLIKTLK